MTTKLGRRLLVIGAALAVLAPMTAAAQNNSSVTATPILVGQSPLAVSVPGANAPNWYRLEQVYRRSYCVEVTGGPGETRVFDSGVVVYNWNVTSVLASNNNTAGEPYSLTGSRACWVAHYNGTAYVNVSAMQQANLAMRVVETTLYGNYYYVGGGYDTYIILRNTTDRIINYTVTFRTQGGAVNDDWEGELPANGGVQLSARSIVPTHYPVGVLDVAHDDGSPQGVMGSVTTVSATTGVAIDTPLVQRVPW